MTQFINTIISIFLAFFIIIIGGLVHLGFQNDLKTQRTVLNEMTNLIDKVEDTGVLSAQDKSDFYLALSATGTVFEVDMIREMKVVNPKDAISGEIVTSYVRVDESEQFNKGDHFSVHVKAVDYTGAQKLISMVLNIINAKFDETQTGVVDNG